MNNKEYIEVDLFQLLKAFWHRAWVIVLAMLLCGAGAFSWAAFLAAPQYEAQALLYVNNSSFSLGSTNFSISDSELTAAQSLVDTYIVVLETRNTLEDVIREAQLHYTYEQLRDMVDAAAVNNTEVFSVTVTSTDPAEAEQIANAITRILPEKIADIVDGSSVRTVDFAVLPTERSAPSISVFTAIGMLLGLVVSCFIVILLSLRDDVIHTEEYLTETYGLPVLAAIPNLLNKDAVQYGYTSYGEHRTKAAKKVEGVRK